MAQVLFGRAAITIRLWYDFVLGNGKGTCQAAFYVYGYVQVSSCELGRYKTLPEAIHG